MTLKEKHGRLVKGRLGQLSLVPVKKTEGEKYGQRREREQFTHVRTACMMHTYIYSFFVSWHNQVVGLETEAARHLNGVRARVLRTQGKRFLIEVPSS